MAKNEELLRAVAEVLRPQLAKARRRAKRRKESADTPPIDPELDGVAAARRAAEVYRQALNSN